MSSLANSEIDALEKAEDLLGEAFDASPQEAVKIALRAIEASPLCADAYAILAVNGGYRGHEALQVWRSGLAAAEMCLKDSFKRYKGDFWGFHETRPYMRAKYGLATALLANAQAREAIEHLAEMLELNPNDNQGARYTLVECYLAGRKDEAARELLAQYPDDGTAWFTWSGVLLAFRRSGAGPASEAALAKALEINPHVPAYLTGKRKVPKQLPDSYEIGEADEAQLYAKEAIVTWMATEGALQWLRAATKTILAS